jgi:hypothetical protein
MNSALVLHLIQSIAHVPTGKVLDDSFQAWVFLANDFIKPRRLNSRFLELSVGASGFNCLMLSRIAYEDDAVAAEYVS